MYVLRFCALENLNKTYAVGVEMYLMIHFYAVCITLAIFPKVHEEQTLENWAFKDEWELGNRGGQSWGK